MTDLTPVSPVCAFPFALAVPASHPARDLAGFAAWAKTQPGKTAFATPAAGSLPHILGMKMGRELGIELTHIPYRGGAPALQDLLGGTIPAAIVVLGEVARVAEGRGVRVLAHSGAERTPRLPNLPTFGELGHPGLTAEEWYGVFLPPNAPPALVAGLQRAVAESVASPQTAAAFARLEYRPFVGGSREFADSIRAERIRMGELVRDSGFQPEE